ncbi:MAG: hypothetical protein V7K39_02770, partial [Nostoc sp.]
MIKVLLMVKPIGYSRMERWNQLSLMGSCVNLLEFRLKAIRENANLNTVPFWQKLRNELPLLT